MDIGLNKEDPYGVRKDQLYLLSILKDIDCFCREKGIKYSLNGGTLLGAVRHKGFIPWDDDADIMFDRENYNRFVSEVEKNPNGDDYIIIGDTWVKRITRKDNSRKEIEERCVDLFVMDNIPDNRIIEVFKNLILKILQGMLKKQIDYQKYSFDNKIKIAGTHYLGKIISTSKKQKMYERISIWGNEKETRKKNIYNSSFRQIGLFEYPSNIMNEYIDISFEDTMLMAIKDWDQYLSMAYGNYMELPPESQRKPMHSNIY